ncbi:MAG: ABC transporter permease subunit [Acidobacteria bacterium]|nr:ABC transporter permease subunit [Acidobacteriota bacterium]
MVDTFREAMARKTFWGLFGLSTLMILFFLFLLKIDVAEGAIATLSLFGHTSGRQMEVSRLVRQFYAGIATFLYTWGMFLSAFASAGLVPSILEPGRIELLLSKPVWRWQILLGRYVGNVLIIALNTTYVVVGVWLIFGAKTGVWLPGFLWTIATTTFIFAVLLSVVFLVGVLFESAALATMVTAGLMIVSPLLAQTRLMDRLLSSEWSRWLWRTLYNILPKVYDLGHITLDVVRGNPAWNPFAIWSSALFALVMLSLGLFVFAKRDF